MDGLYWALVISSTTLGETAGDLISQTLGLGYGGATAVAGFAYFVSRAWCKKDDAPGQARGVA